VLKEFSLLSNKAVATNVSGFLAGWSRGAGTPETRVLLTMANTLERYRTGIHNWYHYPISSAPMERVNNKIIALQRMEFGHRDKDYCLESLHALRFAGFSPNG
jgi:hypothetical protein